jgi:hypothetical protein
MAVTTGEWRSPSGCSASTCVEVGRDHDYVFIRDGNLGDASPVLAFSIEEWEAFLAAVKVGEYG